MPSPLLRLMIHMPALINKSTQRGDHCQHTAYISAELP